MAASKSSRVAIAALAIVGGGLLGATTYGFMYAEALSYLSSDPKACVNCHIMRSQYDAWSKSSHHAVATCVDCHVPHDLIGKYLTKVEHGYRHSKGFTFQDFHEPIRITEGSHQIVEANCLRCHQTLVAQTLDGGHGMGCIRCHAGIGHGARR